MTKNILIISSNHTGHGHKSITESLCEQFAKHDNIKVHVVDGFSLGGNALLKIGKSYGPITRTAKDLWKFVWDISSIKPSVINEIIELKIKDNLLKLLNEVKPDLILSVHPNFNGSIINILEKQNIRIPFVTLIADLVSIYPLWADPRVDYIISPTKEAEEKCIEFGVSPEKIKVLGFPVRARFCRSAEASSENHEYSTDKPLKCLLMSGGEGVGNMRKIAEILLDNFNCVVRIIAGRNKALKKRLEQTLGAKYGDKVEIYGFMDNVQELMLSSDIAFTRASPNVMLEAISCNLPLVLTGALPGQEEGNPGFAEKYNLAVDAKSVKGIKDTIENLLSNNAAKLNEIKRSQRSFNNPNVAKDIADFLMSIETDEIIATVEDFGLNTSKINYKKLWQRDLEKSKVSNIK